MDNPIGDIQVPNPNLEPSPPLIESPILPKKSRKKWVVALVLAGIVLAGLCTVAAAAAGVTYFLLSQKSGEEAPVVVAATPFPSEAVIPLGETATAELNPEATMLEGQEIWEIAYTMLRECSGAHRWRDRTPASLNEQNAYFDEMVLRIRQNHPELNRVGIYLQGGSHVVLSDSWQTPPNPFSDFDGSGWTIQETDVVCEKYILAFDGSLDENHDGDGILVGEAWLFYEVGGIEPYVLDGELQEVYFVFPPNP